jgi:hypothetical protein
VNGRFPVNPTIDWRGHEGLKWLGCGRSGFAQRQAPNGALSCGTPKSGVPDGDTRIGFQALHLVATVIATGIDAGDRRPGRRLGHPPSETTETLRVAATRRLLLREGMPGRGLIFTEEQASGSTLPRWLARWAMTGQAPAAVSTGLSPNAERDCGRAQPGAR